MWTIDSTDPISSISSEVDMKRKLATYFPLAVLAVALVLGMAAALMALRPDTSGQAYAATQQAVEGSPQASLGSALVDPGDETSTLATITIVFDDQDLGSVPPEHPLIFPIASDGSLGNYLSGDVSNINGTGVSYRGNQTISAYAAVTITFTTITDSATVTPALLGQPISNVTFTIDDRGVVTQLADLARQGLNDSQKSALARSQGNLRVMDLSTKAWGGPVAAPARLACNVCKGGASAFSADVSVVPFTWTKEVSPDGSPSGTRAY